MYVAKPWSANVIFESNTVLVLSPRILKTQLFKFLPWKHFYSYNKNVFFCYVIQTFFNVHNNITVWRIIWEIQPAQLSTTEIFRYCRVPINVCGIIIRFRNGHGRNNPSPHFKQKQCLTYPIQNSRYWSRVFRGKRVKFFVVFVSRWPTLVSYHREWSH